MKIYYLRYRFKKYTLWGHGDEWNTKSYKAQDINDLIEKINEITREYYEVYIISIYEVGKNE